MKGPFWVAGVAALGFSCSAAGAAVLSVGGPLSTNCYRAALADDAGPSTIESCTRSLNEEALSTRDRAATHVNRGILLMTARRLADADADFDAALRLEPSLADGWLNKGFLRLRQGHGREALPLIQKGIDAGAGRQALAIFARGVAYEQMGQFASAYADLRRAQQLAPGWALPKEYLADYRVVSR
jgi:tetratricopeptide (TPR) repeat protein